MHFNEPAASRSCFVMMPFGTALEEVYERAMQPAATSMGLRLVRGDQQGGLAVMEGITSGIEEATICLADLTGLNHNVVFEVAMAISKRQRVILITQDATDLLPFDLRPLRVHRYQADASGLERLKQLLHSSFQAELAGEDSPIRLLQTMIRPASIGVGRRNVVAASPLSWRQARQQGGGFKRLRHTSSDHVGIRGLIYAFGATSGLQELPDLVDPGDYESNVALTPANLFCLGSPKANRWTGLILKEFCEARIPRFAFRANPFSENLRDVRIDLHMNDQTWLPAHWPAKQKYERDFGLIIRGPHPKDSGCLVMVLAGRGAVGTEAACRAVTEDRPLARIKDRLQRSHGIDLNAHQQAFWAIVELESDDAGEARPETLGVCAVGAFRGGLESGA
jgi:hypothetical protein